MHTKSRNTFYCFSPPVMAATALIELSLLVYTLVRYRLNRLGRLVAATLFLLAAFQIAEYHVCGGAGLSASTWSRIGFVVIALLPPLGIDITLTIAKKSVRWLKNLAYLNSLVWLGLFGLSTHAFSGYMCTSNYIIFQLTHSYGLLYLIYYYFWLFIGLGLAYSLSRQVAGRQRDALQKLIGGYCVFMVPTAIINTLDTQTQEGLPSILCGFAVFFALILVFGILPKVGLRKVK